MINYKKLQDGDRKNGISAICLMVLSGTVFFASGSRLFAPEQPVGKDTFIVTSSSRGFTDNSRMQAAGTDNNAAADRYAPPRTKPALPASSMFTLAQSTPAKIFTPNGDGINDTFNLTFNNPEGNIISEKKVYDINGRDIADFQVVGVDETQPVVTLIWDGRDRSGNYVRSGVYIYQIQSAGQIINGTVVVAR